MRPKDGKDLPKLFEGLKKLSKSDALVVCTTEESGERVIAGCGELRVEICLKDLRDFICGDPVVSDCETSYTTTNGTCKTSSCTAGLAQRRVTEYKDMLKYSCEEGHTVIGLVGGSSTFLRGVVRAVATMSTRCSGRGGVLNNHPLTTGTALAFSLSRDVHLQQTMTDRWLKTRASQNM